MNTIKTEAIALLQALIQTPSISKTEEKTAALLFDFFTKKGIEVQQSLNNVWVKNLYFDASKPTILLNSHHDTVKPNPNYTRNPFDGIIQGDKLFGLGSNDAGGPLVALIGCFLHFYAHDKLNFNLILAASSEEEISGKNGIEHLLPKLGKIDFAIVGEPTQMNIAIAEKGLLVIDCVAHGKAGHAARKEGVNAIYSAITDIEWFRTYQFPKSSDLLGEVKMSVTMLNAGTQHNVVPDTCNFTVDIRSTDCYSNENIIEIIRTHTSSSITPRSLRLNSSSISPTHKIVQAGLSLSRLLFGSPTLSDQALMPFDSIKMGPGDSARSHTSDEFIFISEINEGIDLYIQLLQKYTAIL